MPTGTYNVSRLLEELGLKNVLEMPVRPDIQATIPLQSMAGQVPVHVTGVAMFGGSRNAIAGERGHFEMVCLDPGGGVVMWIKQGAQSSQLKAFTIEVNTTAAVLTAPFLSIPAHFSRVQTRSLMNIGTVAGATNVQLPIVSEPGPGGFAPLWVPPGSRVHIVQQVANQQALLALGWCGIAATESES